MQYLHQHPGAIPSRPTAEPRHSDSPGLAQYYREVAQTKMLSVAEEKALFGRIHGARGSMLYAAAKIPSLARYIYEQARVQKEELESRAKSGSSINKVHAIAYINGINAFLEAFTEKSDKHYPDEVVCETAAEVFIGRSDVYDEIVDRVKRLRKTTKKAVKLLTQQLVEVGLDPVVARERVETMGADVLVSTQSPDDARRIEAARKAFRKETAELTVPLQVLSDVVIVIVECDHKIKQEENKAVVANLRLAMSVANDYVHQLPGRKDDLIQEANVGLMRAVKRFDDSLGISFSTYAHYWIRQAVERFVIKHSRVIQIPENLHYLLVKYNKSRQDLLNRGIVPKDVSVIAENAAISMDDVSKLKDIPTSIRSLHEMQNENDGSPEIQELLEGDEDIDLPAIEQALLRHTYRTLFERLDERERLILNHYYGLEGFEKEAPSKIANKLKLSTERVRVIRLAALAKLKDPELLDSV